MSYAPEKVAAAVTTLRYWWDRLPVDKRQRMYRLFEIDCPLPKNTAVVGEALRHNGWTTKRRGNQHFWYPPAGTELPVNDETPLLKQRIKALEIELASVQRDALTEESIRRRIIGLRDGINNTEVPEWMITQRKHSSPGVPTLFLSDLHWGEVVKSAQINNVNQYNLQIAHERMKILIDSAVALLEIISPKFDYPGIVLALGGDMISGNIHDELTATNEINTMPTVIDLYGVLVGVIEKLADRFGNVRIPCVTGNHGRDTKKIWAKDRHATSFDWLLYAFLEKNFENDKRVTFLIPDGPDAHYELYGHKYVLTHGDQFRGGDGMIGALGPIIRGDHRKRGRNAQVDMGYDTLIMGHWHSYMHLTRVIVNGSLKGYDEYAFASNFSFEPPQQALWMTHPKYGITYRMPVFVGKAETSTKTWFARAA